MRFLPLFTFFLTLCIVGCTPKKKEKVLIIEEVMDLETMAFISFWKDFSSKFNSLDTAFLKHITLDSVWLWGEHITSEAFITRYHKGYLNSGFSKIILDTNKTSYSSIGCHPFFFPPVEFAIKQEYGTDFQCREATIRDTLESQIDALEFTFLTTTKGYRLSGIKNYSYTSSRFDPMIDTTKPEK